MCAKAQTIFSVIEKIAPRSLAESWDNVGLQLGSYRQEVSRVLLALDITKEVVDEAVEKQADLIISHHPFIFGGIKKICFDDYKGDLIRRLISHDIALYAAHTNLDMAESGLNTYIAGVLGLKNIRPMTADDQPAFGCIGEIDPVMPEEMIRLVKERLGVDTLRVTGLPDHPVKKVALCTGSGSEFMGTAKRLGADVYITGDMKHHEAQRAIESGIWVIDAGHFGTERMVVQWFKDTLEAEKTLKNVDFLIAESIKDYMMFV